MKLRLFLGLVFLAICLLALAGMSVRGTRDAARFISRRHAPARRAGAQRGLAFAR